jgi:4-amino-4-deoxy-L-arabinose transferase-like glycosyltransferase
MALSGDLVTLRVDGIRYLEKAPLPYWLVALSFRLFGFNTFAAHLPQAIGVLLLVMLGYRWADRAFNTRTAFYTGLAILTSTGVFLFTRYFIPEVLLSLFLSTALYCLLCSLEDHIATAPGAPSFAALSQRVGYSRDSANRTLSSATPTSCGPPLLSPS